MWLLVNFKPIFFEDAYRLTQPTFTCSKSTTEILEKGRKYVQS